MIPFANDDITVIDEPDLFHFRSIWHQPTYSYLKEYFKRITKEIVIRFEDPKLNTFFRPEKREMQDFYRYICIRTFVDLDVIRKEKEEEEKEQEKEDPECEINISSLISNNQPKLVDNYLSIIKNNRSILINEERKKFKKENILYFNCDLDYHTINKILNNVA